MLSHSRLHQTDLGGNNGETLHNGTWLRHLLPLGAGWTARAGAPDSGQQRRTLRALRSHHEIERTPRFSFSLPA